MGTIRTKGHDPTMDKKQIEDLFRATDDGDAERLCRYFHPDLVLTMLGVEGVDAPFDRPGYLRFLEESIAYRSGRGEQTEHVPTHVKIGDAMIAIRGLLRISSRDEADEYHPYTDLLKLRDGQIVEYNIAYDI
jgi:ketosteroid isomerase-like protein